LKQHFRLQNHPIFETEDKKYLYEFIETTREGNLGSETEEFKEINSMSLS
jgi:hypothetical protein